MNMIFYLDSIPLNNANNMLDLMDQILLSIKALLLFQSILIGVTPGFTLVQLRAEIDKAN